MIKPLLLSFFIASATLVRAQDPKTYKVATVAFYNLENLFDFEDDPLTFDDDRTPEGKDRWTEGLYLDKLKNMARVISEIGADVTGTAPAIIGVCEAENLKVLEDLVNAHPLLDRDYGIIHFDSPDRRGIDVALLYQKKIFVPIHYTAVPLLIYADNDPTNRVYTRDQLVVSGLFDGEKMHFIVNHWPSRSGGEARSRPKRIKAAELNKRIIDSLFSEDPYAKIITMGDLNDDPTNTSIKEVLKTKGHRTELQLKELYNPMEEMFANGLGTLAYRDGWNLFDQIILSSELLEKEYGSYRFFRAGIFNRPYLSNPSGQYRGYPFRSYTDAGYTGGYSDHFPVFVYLIKQIQEE